MINPKGLPLDNFPQPTDQSKWRRVEVARNCRKAHYISWRVVNFSCLPRAARCLLQTPRIWAHPRSLLSCRTGIRDDRESYFPAIRCKRKEKSPAEKFLGKNMSVWYKNHAISYPRYTFLKPFKTTISSSAEPLSTRSSNRLAEAPVFFGSKKPLKWENVFLQWKTLYTNNSGTWHTFLDLNDAQL